MVKEMKELNIMAKTENSAKDGVVSESESEMSTVSNKGKAWERNTSDISDFGKSDNKSIDKKLVQDKPNSKSAIASDKGPSASFSSSYDDDFSAKGKEKNLWQDSKDQK